MFVGINECDPKNRRDDCQQICVDIDKDPGYTCACNTGYRLADNQRNCSGICFVFILLGKPDAIAIWARLINLIYQYITVVI